MLCVQVSEAIKERAKRIYDKYGNVMLEVKGMTKAGVERKATCRALFSKLLYLAGMLRDSLSASVCYVHCQCMATRGPVLVLLVVHVTPF